MARPIGTTGSAPPSRTVKVKAHTRKAPTPKAPSAAQVIAATNPRPVKPVRVRVTAPPQTPDSRDNNANARRPPVSHVSPDAQDIAGRSPQQHAHDAAVVRQTVSQQRLKVLREREHTNRNVVRIVTQGLHGKGPARHQIGTVTLGLQGIGLIPDPHSRFLKDVGKAAKNAPKDAAELAVTTPSSVAKLASDVVHHPAKVPGELAKPYVQLAKNPEGFATSHPVSTALMVAPGVRMPGRIVGKALRVAGKQTLERPPATLPETALKEPRIGSRDALVRHLQSRKDAKTGPLKVTVRQVQRRVDETFGKGQKHRERVTSSVLRVAHQQAKALPKAARPAHIDAARLAARGAVKEQNARSVVHEFGAVHQITPQGHIVKPKAATEGALHDTRDAAQRVADHLNKRPVLLTRGGFTAAERTLPFARQKVPVNFVVHKAGEKYGVIPDFVAERLRKHGAVGSSLAPGAKILRISRGAFTRAVLPYRPTWLSGQGFEGAVRNIVHGAGPTSYLRARRVAAAMNRDVPGSGQRLLERAVPGGKIGKVFKETADLEHMTRPLAEEFPDNPIAHALTDLGKAPGIKQVRQLHHAVATTVFTHLNGRFLEGVPQTAMLGKALKNSPLMERSTIGLFGKAIDDAAKGAQATDAQVALARNVQRGYGKYSNYGPAMREAILHWTPFIPWFLNSARFLLSVLPKDHPIATGLLADVSAAEEDWRKAHDLSLRQPNHVPFFLLGSYPKKNGGLLELGHYLPSGAAQDPTQGLAGAVLPQFASAYGAIRYGLDWKGKPLVHPDGTPYTDAEKWLYGLGQLGEAMIPLAGQTATVAGSDDKAAALRKQFRLMASTPGSAATTSTAPIVNVKPIKIKPVKVKPIRVKPIKIR